MSDELDQWVVQRGGVHGIPPALPETVDVVPEDLSHFAELLGSDIDAYNTAKQQAYDEMFSVFPSFAGSRAANGGLPEGAAFEEAYWRVVNSTNMLLSEAGMGMMMLEFMASVTGLAYPDADIFSPDFQGDEALAQVLGGVGLLERPPQGAPPDGETQPEFESAAQEQWEEYRASLDDGQNNVQGDPDASGGHDRSEGRHNEQLYDDTPAEYLSETDHENVSFRDSGFALPGDHYGDDVSDLEEDADLVLNQNQGTDWEHPVPEQDRMQP